MSLKFSIQFKILITVILTVVVILSILAFSMVKNQKEILHSSYRNLGVTLAKTLDAGITSKSNIEDTDKLQNTIYKTMWLSPEVVEISIALPEDGELEIKASNKTGLIGEKADSKVSSTFKQGQIKTDSVIDSQEGKCLRVIAPVHVAGRIEGVYDVSLSLKSLEGTTAKTQNRFLAGIIVAIATIIIVLSLVIRYSLIKPIQKLRKASKEIGSGNFSYKIDIKRNDEIGDLADTLNTTKKKLKESTKELEQKVKERTEELEEARKVLEVRVRARTRELRNLAEEREKIIQKRTKELRERIEELERFRELTVGREKKMMELKKELKKSREKIRKLEKEKEE